jgi:hypothetical protein
MKLPKQIFVEIEDPGRGEKPFLSAHETFNTVAALGERKVVGKYIFEKLLTVETEIKVRNKTK